MTQDELIKHGAVIERLMSDKDVQAVFAALEEYYFKNWKTAEVSENRQMIWDEMRALDRLKQALERVVAIGQSEQARAERTRNQD